MNNSTPNIPQINIESIAERCKREWMKQTRKHLSIQERLASSVPWWLLIIAGAAFALSAGHTAGMFGKLSPVGYVAPFLIEFGLLWAAFVRILSRQGKMSVTLALRALELLFFIMAVAANGTGALSRVAEQAGIQQLSLRAIGDAFGQLAITTQMEMVLIPLFALAIPIVTWVVGEGLASLFLESRRSGSLLEEKWREVEQEQMRRALYAEFVRHMTSQEAKRASAQMSASYTHGQVSGVRTVSASSIKQVSAPVVEIETRRVSAADKQRRADARFVVRAYLEQNPDAQSMSVRELARTLAVSKTIAAEELAAFKNGRH